MLGSAAAVATATFALADALLWRDLPYRSPGQLHVLVTTSATGEEGVSFPDFNALREGARGARLAASVTFLPDYAMTGVGEPRQLRARLLSSNYFETLGVPLAAGRDFRRDDEGPSAGFVAILTDRLWADLFGRRADVVGSALTLNGRSYEIVGILAPHRDPLDEVDIYVPIPSRFAATMPRRRMLAPIVRLTEASRPQFESEVQRLTGKTGDLEAAGHQVQMMPLQGRLASRLSTTVSLLFGSGVALLAIALLNLAVLSASRTRQRLTEFSTRLALGARPRQVLTLAALDMVPISLIAAGLAYPSSRLLVTLLRDQYGSDVVTSVNVESRALLFLAAILAGAIVVAFVAASRACASMRSMQRSVAASQLAAGRPFVIAQIAVSLALVITSALLAKSFVALRNVDPGFEVSGLQTTRVAASVARYVTLAARAEFWRTFLERLDAAGLPAALTTQLPLSNTRLPLSFLAHLSNGARVPFKIRSVSAGYFDLLDIPLREGRALAASDHADAPRVVVINESLAARLASVGPAVGQTVGLDFVDPPYLAQVVGVYADIRQEGLGATATPEAYLPFEQSPDPIYAVVVSSDRHTADVTRAIRATMNTIDPGQPFGPVVPMIDYVERSLASPRIQAQLMAAFAVVALLVAMTGLYGLLAFLTDGSRREWALRLALGASPLQIQHGVFRLAVTCSVLATALGLAVVFAAGTTLKTVLYGVEVWDPIVVGASTFFMMATCMLAAVGPAMRAGEIDAAEALRT
jgi:predicted permease